MTMELNDIVMNPEHVRAFYPDGPRLQEIVLHEIGFHRDGPIIRLRFDLQDLPPKPPKKWHAEFNTAQMTIVFIEVSAVNLQDWGTFEAGELKIVIASNLINFSFTGTSCRLTGHARFARVENISGYNNGAEPQR